jgi:molybdate transport repressor ModE-like protein
MADRPTVDRRSALTPDALAMMDAIAKAGSFAAAARELGKVPSALTYAVRQLEDALDVLLFDRKSGQAQLTAAGEELLREGRRLLAEMDAVANRVRRVACGWETQLTVAADGVISRLTMFELCEAFYALRPTEGSDDGPGTRLRLRTEILAGTWEALLAGEADLAIGVGSAALTPPAGIALEPLGEIDFVFAVAPHHRDPAPPRGGRRRLGAPPRAADLSPAAGPRRVHGGERAGQARSAGALPGLRLSGRACRA